MTTGYEQVHGNLDGQQPGGPPVVEILTDDQLIPAFKAFAASEAREPYDFNQTPSVASQPVVARAAGEFASQQVSWFINASGNPNLIKPDRIEDLLEEYYDHFPTLHTPAAVAKEFASARNLHGVVAMRHSLQYPEVKLIQRLHLVSRKANEVLISRSTADLLAAYGQVIVQDLHLGDVSLRRFNGKA